MEEEEEVETVVPEGDVGEGSLYYGDWNRTKPGCVAFSISDTSPVSLLPTRVDLTTFFTEADLGWRVSDKELRVLAIYANSTVFKVKTAAGRAAQEYIVCQFGNLEVAKQVTHVSQVPVRRFLKCVSLSAGPMTDRMVDLSLHECIVMGVRWATSDEQNELHKAFYDSKFGESFVPVTFKKDVFSYYEELKEMNLDERIIATAKFYEQHAAREVVEKEYPAYSSGRSAEKVQKAGKALEEAFKKMAPLLSLYANKHDATKAELKKAAEKIDALTDGDLPYALAFLLDRLGPGPGAVPEGAPGAAPASGAGTKRKQKGEDSSSSGRGRGAAGAAKPAAAPKKPLEGLPQKVDRLEKELAAQKEAAAEVAKQQAEIVAQLQEQLATTRQRYNADHSTWSLRFQLQTQELKGVKRSLGRGSSAEKDMAHDIEILEAPFNLGRRPFNQMGSASKNTFADGGAGSSSSEPAGRTRGGFAFALPSEPPPPPRRQAR